MKDNDFFFVIFKSPLILYLYREADCIPCEILFKFVLLKQLAKTKSENTFPFA